MSQGILNVVSGLVGLGFFVLTDIIIRHSLTFKQTLELEVDLANG